MPANLTKVTAPYWVVKSPLRRTVRAGEILPVACPVYIHSDGKAYKCVSTACTIGTISKWDGLTQQAAAIGDAVTVMGVGARMHVCASGITIGAFYFVSGTAGAISDTKIAATDTNYPCFKGVSATDLEVVRPPL
jgi:hypothetical protein